MQKIVDNPFSPCIIDPSPNQSMKLSDINTEKVPSIFAEAFKNALSTNRLDYDQTVDTIHKFQEIFLEVPKTPVVIVDNPLEGWVASHFIEAGYPINNIKENIKNYFEAVPFVEEIDNFDKTEKVQIGKFFYPLFGGSLDSLSHTFFDFYMDLCNDDLGEYREKYLIWKEMSQLGAVYFMDKVAIASQKVTTLKFNENKQFHNDSGPAISYAGYGDLNYYCINGVVVPDWLANTHSSQIDINRYTEITNADVRMEFIRKVGIERMLSFGTKLDTYENYDNEWWTNSEYELHDMNCLFPGVDYAPHLKMLNQTTRVWHVEAVDPRCKTLEDAINFRFNDRKIKIIGIA